MYLNFWESLHGNQLWDEVNAHWRFFSDCMDNACGRSKIDRMHEWFLKLNLASRDPAGQVILRVLETGENET